MSVTRSSSKAKTSTGTERNRCAKERGLLRSVTPRALHVHPIVTDEAVLLVSVGRASARTGFLRRLYHAVPLSHPITASLGAPAVLDCHQESLVVHDGVLAKDSNVIGFGFGSASPSQADWCSSEHHSFTSANCSGPSQKCCHIQLSASTWAGRSSVLTVGGFCRCFAPHAKACVCLTSMDITTPQARDLLSRVSGSWLLPVTRFENPCLSPALAGHYPRVDGDGLPLRKHDHGHAPAQCVPCVLRIHSLGNPVGWLHVALLSAFRMTNSILFCLPSARGCAVRCRAAQYLNPWLKRGKRGLG